MRQMMISDFALPELWIVNKLPELDGIYKCKVKENGKYEFRDVEFKDKEFKTKGLVVYWKC